MQKLESFDRTLERLRQESEKNPIVVEGYRDVEALGELGIEKNVHTLSRKPLHEIAHELRHHKEVILLTDNDVYGKKVTRKLKDFFLNEGIHPNLRFRYEFMRLGLDCTENLVSRREEIEKEETNKRR
jgi:5S rRNA maturation endonuclease (ribonuclease M5)